MPRKFKLIVKRKYDWKSKQQAFCLIVPPSLIVSLTRSVVLSTETSSLAVLRQRITEASAIPPGSIFMCI